MTWYKQLVAWWDRVWGMKNKLKPEPKPEPKTEPEDGDALDIKSISWLGDDYSNAMIAAGLQSATLSNHSFDMSNAAPSHWAITTVKKRVQGIVCLFYERGGKIVGGKFDWLTPGQTKKDLANLRNGYHGHTFPEQGAKCYAMYVSIGEGLRSNLVAVQRIA